MFYQRREFMALDPGSDGVPIGTSHLTKNRRIRGGH